MTLPQVVTLHLNGALATRRPKPPRLGPGAKVVTENAMPESNKLSHPAHERLAASSLSKPKVQLTADHETPGVLLRFLCNRPHRRLE